MSSEISHIIYSARVLTNISGQVKDPLYWVGTLMPNMRRLGVKSRFFLHPDNVSLYSLLGQDDFSTGMRVHSWVDATFGHYWEAHHLDDKLPWSPLTRAAFKLMEDEELYDHFDDWNLIHRLLNRVHDEEAKLVSDRKAIEKWHSLLQGYVYARPDNLSRRKFLTGMGISRKLADEINAEVARLYKNNEAQEAMRGMWRNAEDLLM